MVPPVSLTYSRRLFPHSNTQGTFFCSAPSSSSILPVLSFNVSSVHPFDLSHEADTPSSVSGMTRLRPPSSSGLSRGQYYYGFGVSLDGVIPGLNAEYGITFAELGVQLKAAVQAGIAGVATVLSAAWEGHNKGADAEVSLHPLGVQLKLGFVFSFFASIFRGLD